MDRRWHPPEETPDERVITSGPRHMAASHGPDGRAWDDDPAGEQPPWTDVGVPIALAVLVVAVVVIGILWVRSFSAIGNDRSLDAEPAHDNLATTPTSAVVPEVPETDASPTTDQPPAGASESSETDGSTAETTVQPPPAVSDGSATAGEADSPPAAEDGRDAASPEPGGSADDCPVWTPPGRPDHPVAPDRANHCD
jgi:hypothetical protein